MHCTRALHSVLTCLSQPPLHLKVAVKHRGPVKRLVMGELAAVAGEVLATEA